MQKFKLRRVAQAVRTVRAEEGRVASLTLECGSQPLV
jgi:hypothetical protein